MATEPTLLSTPRLAVEAGAKRFFLGANAYIRLVRYIVHAYPCETAAPNVSLYGAPITIDYDDKERIDFE